MLSRILGAIGRTLVTSGTLILLFVAYQLWGTGLQEARSQRALASEYEQLEAQIQAQRAASTTTSTTTTTTTSTPEPDGNPGLVPQVPVETEPAPVDLPLPEKGDPIGRIRIPDIGVSRMVVESVDLDELKRGPGHYEESPLPGQPGNVSIAGHRTTYGQPFHNVDKLEAGDEIFFETLQGTFRYRLDRDPFVVDDSDVSVLEQHTDASGKLINKVTLIACEPKYSAAKRMIVTAVLDGTPAPPIVGQDEKRERLAEEKGVEDPFAVETIDGGLSGNPASRTPTVIWGLVCAAIWLATWLVQTWLRRRVRASAAAEDRRPTRRERLLTWAPYLAGTPVFLVALYVFFENFGRLLPGNY